MKKILLVFVLFVLIMPTIALAAIVECGNDINDPCTLSSIEGMILHIIDFIIYDIVPAAAILFLTIGGIILLVSGGNPGLKTLGRNILMATVIGMALVYGALAIINLILTTLGAAPLP